MERRLYDSLFDKIQGIWVCFSFIGTVPKNYNISALPT